MPPENYTLEVHGNPVPYRERTFLIAGKFVRSHLDKNCRKWEAAIRTEAQRIYDGILEGPLLARVQFRLLRPKSRPKKYRHPDKRPDLDNLGKSGIDGINGILIRDDAQIVSLLIEKHYCRDGEAPGVRIDVEKIKD